MAMRDLVTGGANCAVEGSSSSANPFGTLANALLGNSKTAQDLKGLPSASVTVSDPASSFRHEAPLTTIPGSEYDNQQYPQAEVQGSEFLRGFRAAENVHLAEAWNEIHRPAHLPSHGQIRGGAPHFSEFEQIYEQHSAGAFQQPLLDGPPQRVLSSFLHSFVDSSRVGIPFRPAPLPTLGLSEGDKQCIRDRTCIMARHIFADKSEEYINAQVNALLYSLDIDGASQLNGPARGPYSELEEYWTESQGTLRPRVSHHADGWVTEFNQQRLYDNPVSWAKTFEQQHGANGWASEFEQEQSQMLSMGMKGANMSNIAAIEQTRMLANTLAQNKDPKFQVSLDMIHQYYFK